MARLARPPVANPVKGLSVMAVAIIVLIIERFRPDTLSLPTAA